MLLFDGHCLGTVQGPRAGGSYKFGPTRFGHIWPMQLLPGCGKLESKVCYIGIVVDDALEIAGQAEL